MKKILLSIIAFISCLLLVGCSCMNNTAKDEVEKFLDQYRNLSSSVLTDLESVIEKENLTDEQKEVYRDILKKQYSDLKYEVIDETYNGDTAVVKTKITVYNLYEAQSSASSYLNSHMDEFKDEDGKYDNDLYLDYKLKQMKEVTDTVEYTIDFNVEKDDNGNWKVTNLSDTDLEKIHGIYNYDND